MLLLRGGNHSFLAENSKAMQLSHCSADRTVFPIETAGVIEVDAWSGSST